jgi:hypothetical protein
MYSGFMSSEKNDDLQSFQIGLRSGVSGSQKKSIELEKLEVSKDDFPTLSSSIRSKSTFKKKAGEKVDALKKALKDGPTEEKEDVEKAKKAWERAMELIAHASLKE